MDKMGLTNLEERTLEGFIVISLWMNRKSKLRVWILSIYMHMSVVYVFFSDQIQSDKLQELSTCCREIING